MNYLFFSTSDSICISGKRENQLTSPLQQASWQGSTYIPSGRGYLRQCTLPHQARTLPATQKQTPLVKNTKSIIHTCLGVHFPCSPWSPTAGHRPHCDTSSCSTNSWDISRPKFNKAVAGSYSILTKPRETGTADMTFQAGYLPFSNCLS